MCVRMRARVCACIYISIYKIIIIMLTKAEIFNKIKAFSVNKNVNKA